MVTGFLTGFGTGFSLILAIGAQNAFVLRQGLARSHVFWVCLICAVSDAALILVGVFGFSLMTKAVPWLATALTLGGAAFLIVYGALSLRRALRPGALRAEQGTTGSLRLAIMTTLALTWLNPHVYLDTVSLLGAVSLPFEGAAKQAFAAGAVSASFVFFFSLGYGARLLAPTLSRPGAWAVLDTLIALVMWTIAVTLLMTL